MALAPVIHVPSTVDLPTGDHHRVLLIDDDEEDAIIVRDLLDEVGGDWSMAWQASCDGGLAELATGQYSACIVDYRLGRDSGLDFLDKARSIAENVPVLLLTGEDSRDLDLAAMRAGAVDFLSKERLQADTLERALRYAVERVRTRAQLVRLARRDPLTGLHNRTSIDERIADAVARARRSGIQLGVCMVDLDGFKAVNDNFGHEVGDELLGIIGQRLRATVRPYDAVGRIGGDEFVVVLEDIESTEEGLMIAQRLVEAVKPPFELRVPLTPVSASVGLAVFPGCGADAKDLLRAADAAMYEAKRRGKARAELSSGPVTGFSIPGSSEELLKAIDAGEFQLALQPQVDLHTGRAYGVEALARWNPGGGRRECISTVVAELERAGAIAELDLWVLGQAVRRLDDLPSISRVSVNLSPVTLQTSGLLSRVSSLLPARPGRIEVEITESALIDDVETTCNTLHVLRALGLRVALDDFGTGYSSFTRLRQLPVDTIKVDRSFTRGLNTFERDHAIVEAMLSLGERVGIDVVVEGVETTEQEAALRQLGAVRAQGFLYAKPLSESDLGAWLMQRAA